MSETIERPRVAAAPSDVIGASAVSAGAASTVALTESTEAAQFVAAE